MSDEESENGEEDWWFNMKNESERNLLRDLNDLSQKVTNRNLENFPILKVNQSMLNFKFSFIVLYLTIVKSSSKIGILI